jgi:hypothetical protein
MSLNNLFRHSGLVPESSGFNDFLDTGLRRYDEYKVNGTALKRLLNFFGKVGWASPTEIPDSIYDGGQCPPYRK